MTKQLHVQSFLILHVLNGHDEYWLILVLLSLTNILFVAQVGIVEEPDKAVLTQAWKSWIEEHIKVTGKVPPGNKSGNNTWVKQTPRKKSDIRLTPGRHVELTVPLEELIDRLVKENKVVAFIKGSRSAPQCGFSQRVVGILESQGVDYETVDVLDDDYNHGLREKLKSYSNWPTFPQVFVKGELLGGCDILTSMYENGELANMFKQFHPVLSICFYCVTPHIYNKLLGSLLYFQTCFFFTYLKLADCCTNLCNLALLGFYETEDYPFKYLN